MTPEKGTDQKENKHPGPDVWPPASVYCTPAKQDSKKELRA